VCKKSKPLRAAAVEMRRVTQNSKICGTILQWGEGVGGRGGGGGGRRIVEAGGEGGGERATMVVYDKCSWCSGKKNNSVVR